VRRLRLGLVALAATSLLLVGCSKAEEPEPEPETAPTSEPTEEPEPTLWPLTGLELKGKAPKHPVLVTKIDNTSGSAPQIGLGEADLVVEELVEGGMTRLATFFHSRTPEEVGPVRSMRASDIGIVPPGAVVVTSGAAQVTLDRVAGAGIPWVTEGDEGVYRSSSRSAPYNLFANLDVIAKGTEKSDLPPLYLPFGDTADQPKGRKATTISANFGNHVTNWEYRDGTYVNVNTFASEGDEFPATAVLVMRVDTRDAGYRDPSGAYVPETVLVGTKEALLFHDGRVVRGTWTKKDLDGEITLRTVKGDKMHVPAGNVWIELVPNETGDVAWGQ
jgi:hypothetical protein